MPGKVRFDAAGIRKLVREAVARSSLRAVADEIGVSKSGLDSFLKGREPYSRTRVKLAAWQLRRSQPDHGTVRREDVDAAIALLEVYIQSVGTAAVRRKRVREVADRLFSSEEREG
jgi:hypothetical protein